MALSKPIAARLRAIGRRSTLDRRLAQGRPPEEDAALALRARELTSERSRSELATSLRQVVRDADDPRVRFRPALPLDRPAVAESRPLLLQLAERLQDRAPVNPRGVAMISRLLRDGESPLYYANEPVNAPGPTGPGLPARARGALVNLDP